MPHTNHQRAQSSMRPERVRPVTLAAAAAALPPGSPAITAAPGTGDGAWDAELTGVSINSRQIFPGDLYLALPGARHHGAGFAADAAAAGAAAILTDAEGLDQLPATGLPVFVAEDIRRLVGPLSAAVFNSQPRDGSAPVLFGVTGTNGKTTTTYFITSLLQTLGRTTGLIGTIEILAGGEAIPSILTTPESPQVHGLLALMRERSLDAAAMEVSSHAISYRRVDGVVFDVAGFTNLTQDHLDLHGSMEDYFAAKADLFRSGRSRRAVITVDGSWGRRMAEVAGSRGTTLSTVEEAGDADWQVRAVRREGLGHSFELHTPQGTALRVRTGLPGTFNVSNAALALAMVLESGADADEVQQALDAHDPFTMEVPGRMQLLCEAPAAIVDFAHNPDALQRTLESVRRPEGKVIVVFGATGERDATKRPLMGEIAAGLADVVIVTDDDPHDEDDAAIRADVLRGARSAAGTRETAGAGSEGPVVLEVAPRAAAIARAVELASPEDTILVAGRGHEVWQEVKGVNLALDDRVELRAALAKAGFTVPTSDGVES